MGPAKSCTRRMLRTACTIGKYIKEERDTFAVLIDGALATLL